MKSISKCLTFPLFIILLFSSCSSSVNPKKKIAIQLTYSSCHDASSATSAFFNGAVNGLLSELTDGNVNGVNTGELGSIPGYWCECYTYYVANDLMENFTIGELRELKQDDLKKWMTLAKLFQRHQEEIKNCIAETTNEKIKNYADFERKLNKKLKNK